MLRLVLAMAVVLALGYMVYRQYMAPAPSASQQRAAAEVKRETGLDIPTARPNQAAKAVTDQLHQIEAQNRAAMDRVVRSAGESAP